MSTIKPTIGRKVWFYDFNPSSSICYGQSKPFDATVIYVWSDACVNLDVTAHNGERFIKTSVPLRDPADGDCHNGYFATWMPYQKAQADKAESEAEKTAA